MSRFQPTTPLPLRLSSIKRLLSARERSVTWQRTIEVHAWPSSAETNARAGRARAVSPRATHF
ncbi:hypothetical protein GT025_24000 [Streptomyces sp. SID4920]|nr:hypothetical protein [Streptomyces sp. SID4920]MYX64168.1 hypothetical protein [Streptomyces sp. SID8373]